MSIWSSVGDGVRAYTTETDTGECSEMVDVASAVNYLPEARIRLSLYPQASLDGDGWEVFVTLDGAREVIGLLTEAIARYES